MPDLAASPAGAASPRPRVPEAGAQRAACASLPALPLAPACCRGKSLLLAASFRLSGESVNSTFLISESSEKTHSAAAGCTPGPRAHPPTCKRDQGDRGGKEPGAGAGSEAGPRRKRDREQDAVRGECGPHPHPPGSRQRGAGRRTLRMLGGCGLLRPGAVSGPAPAPSAAAPRTSPKAEAAVAPELVSSLLGNAPLAEGRRSSGALAARRGALSGLGARCGRGSYLIARTPTLVCGSWSPFPVICKTQVEENREERRPSKAQG